MAPKPRPVAERFWSFVDKRGPNDCWSWLGGMGNGYGRFRLSRKEGYAGAHRYSYLLAYGWMPEFVCHHCDNPPCVNPMHLFAGDPKINIDDCLAKGRGRGQFAVGHDARRRGALKSQAKLDAAKVLAIRQDPRTHRIIAAEYGVHHSLISMVKNKRVWADV